MHRRSVLAALLEISSITKLFTALLLADMVQHGEVAWADPAAKYLPPEGRPLFDDKAISLLDLATHTSGLPPDRIYTGLRNMNVLEIANEGGQIAPSSRNSSATQPAACANANTTGCGITWISRPSSGAGVRKYSAAEKR